VRIVHTSDWHTGCRLRTIDRLDELAAALDGLARYVERESVDLVLMSGDIFESLTPPADAERVVFQFFKRLGAARVPSVAVAGNHDSPHRVEAWAQLAELAEVRAVATPRRPEQGGVLELPCRSGETAIVGVVPFATPGRLVTALDLGRGDIDPMSVYRDVFTDLITQLTARFRADTVNLLVAHVHVEGALISGTERQVVMGDQWAVTRQTLPPSAQYLALGHIHRPQEVPAAPAPAVYAGSVLQLDFGEAGQAKSFVVVEAHPRRPAVIERIPYEGTQPLQVITATLPEIERDAEQLRKRGWLQVIVPLERPDPNIAPTVRTLVPNTVVVRQQLPEEPEDRVAIRRGLSPREIYAMYVQERHGFQPGEDLLQAFEALLAQAEQAEQAELAPA
jgi:exonuclease SbcD